MKEFPYIGRDGKMYEAFPCIRLHLSNGGVIDVDYFGKFAMRYMPTRYMQKDGDSIIPIVKYLSWFKTEKDVIDKFLSEIKVEMGNYLVNGVFCINDKTFVNWVNVVSMDVMMKHYVYCYDNVEYNGNSKHGVAESSKYVGLTMDFIVDESFEQNEEEKKDDDVDLKFLDFPMF